MKKLLHLVMIFFIFMTTSSVIAKDYSGEMSRAHEVNCKLIEIRDDFYKSISDDFISSELVSDISDTNVQQEAPLQDYSSEDEYLLAQIVYCEAGGCDEAEMARIGDVVLNRIASDLPDFKYCNSIQDVLYQKGQYPETVDKIRRGIQPSTEAQSVAHRLLSGDLSSGLSKDVLWQTGFIPRFNAHVVYQSPWHYYSVYGR